eukprot:5001420-Prymnesium_polylepis.1
MLPKVKRAEDISKPSKAGNSAIRVRTGRRLRALVPPVDLPVHCDGRLRTWLSHHVDYSSRAFLCKFWGIFWRSWRRTRGVRT